MSSEKTTHLSNAAYPTNSEQTQDKSYSLITAELFPLMIDMLNQVALAHMLEDDFRRSSFLDHRIYRTSNANFNISMVDFMQAATYISSPPCHSFIFHISHVGSTLFSKIIGCQPQVLSLREPLILRWLANLYNELGNPESRVSTIQFNEYFNICLRYLSRQFRPENEVVIKATSYTNVLANRILSQPYKPHAIFVYSGLVAFLATILKGPWGITDILTLAPSRLRRLHQMLAYNAWNLYELSIGEIIAMSWISEMATLLFAANYHPQQVLWIDFDHYLQQDQEVLQPIFQHLGISYSSDCMNSIEASEIIHTNSKIASETYGAQERQRDIDLVRTREAVEIAKGVAWFEVAISRFPAIKNLQPYAQSNNTHTTAQQP